MLVWSGGPGPHVCLDTNPISASCCMVDVAMELTLALAGGALRCPLACDTMRQTGLRALCASALAPWSGRTMDLWTLAFLVTGLQVLLAGSQVAMT